MKGVWRCDKIHARGARACGLWQIHNGRRGKPKRIDVRCDRCDTRHQLRWMKGDGRGNSSSIKYVRFPDDVDLESLLKYARIKNRIPKQLSNTFEIRKVKD